MATSRIIAIEALRFIFIIQICIWHMSVPHTSAGFLGVEFFFILAGIFIYKNATKEKSHGIIRYATIWVSKFYTKYLLAVIFAYVVFIQGVYSEFQHNATNTLLRFFSEALLLQSLGVYPTGVNCPLWFFSALFFGGAFIYGMTKYHTLNCIRFIFPLITLFYFTYTFNYGLTESLESWNTMCCISLPMARAISEIAFGVLLGYLYFNYKHFFDSRIKSINYISVLALIFYCSIVISNRHNSNYAFILIPCIIIAALTPKTWFSCVFSSSIWLKLGRLSFDIYCIHYLLMALLRHFLHVECRLPIEFVAAIYYILLTPAALAYNYIATFLQMKITNRIHIYTI